MPEKPEHLHDCSCRCETDSSDNSGNDSRRDFFKQATTLAAGALLPSAIAMASQDNGHHENEIQKNKAIQKGKAQILTLLHTSDIHAQLYTHDEFFFENGKPVYKKRGGFAVLKTMLKTLKAQNPSNTLIIVGGDCFQGGGVAALTQGKGIVPLINNIGYDLILPGNWEVVYKKEIMLHDLGGYN